MHEEYRDTMRTASTEVGLTGAEDLTVLAGQGSMSWRVWYRPFRLEVISSWPGAKIGNGSTMVHVHCNEVWASGELSRTKVTLLLTDLEVVPDWLVRVVREAERRNHA